MKRSTACIIAGCAALVVAYFTKNWEVYRYVALSGAVLILWGLFRKTIGG